MVILVVQVQVVDGNCVGVFVLAGVQFDGWVNLVHDGLL